MFQTFDSESDPSVGRERVGRLREWLEQPRPRRLPGAARRPASGRVCRAGLGAAALADRLRRFGRRRADPARAGAYLRRRPLHAAGAQPGRSVDLHGREPGRDAAAGLDRARTWARARASASIPGCTPSPTPRRCARPPKRSARHWCAVDAQSDRRIVDRPAGAAARPGSRSSRSTMPASSPRTSWRGLPPRSPRRARRTPCSPITSSVAWAFNIRGNDVPHTPLALAFAMLSAEGPHLLFIDKRKLEHRDRRPI